MTSSIARFGFIQFVFLLLAQFSVSQQLLNLSDEQNISLAIDYVRKGVQQEDIRKILKVCGPTVAACSKQALSKEQIGKQFQTVFDNSSARKMLLTKPSFDRADSPLKNSDFWDFDIFEPTIKISGDTAIVDCRFVLWAEAGANRKHGHRVQGQLIFALFKTPSRSIPEGDEFIPNPSSHEGKNSGVFRNWQLVNLGGLLDFVGGNLQKEKLSK